MIELMAPAGNWESMVAAVQSGADAVYLGGVAFNARGGAGNFETDELGRAVVYCHLRGVKVYLTVNTLVYPNEAETLYAFLAQAVSAGIDAAIVQDMGVAAILRHSFVALPRFASTQLSLTDAAGFAWARDAGFTRAVAARETSLAELRRMAETGIEVEAFAHGALCVSYSGQCLMSSMIGGRSGNRGRCAQPCRLAYSLDGMNGALLSTRDLCTIGLLSVFRETNVRAIKIEGRSRSPQYVAQTTGYYRQALDALEEGQAKDAHWLEEATDRMKAVFNRGNFTPGYAFESERVSALYPKRANHMGVPVGTARQRGNRLQAVFDRDVHKKDVLEIQIVGSPIVFTAQQDCAKGVLVLLQAPVPEGVSGPVRNATIMRLSDEALLREIEAGYRAQTRLSPIDIDVRLHVGEPASIRVNGAEAFGPVVERAQKRPLTQEDVARQIKKLDDAPYSVQRLLVDMDADVYLPLSALNALRRDGITAYDAKMLAARLPVSDVSRLMPDHPVAPCHPEQSEGSFAGVPAERCFADVQHDTQADKLADTAFVRIAPLLVFESDDIDALSRARSTADVLYYRPRDYTRRALIRVRESIDFPFVLVLPPVLESDELFEIRDFISESKDKLNGVLVGNWGHFGALRPCGIPLYGNASLNVLNGYSALEATANGCARVNASLEATGAVIKGLAERVPTEVIVHGRLPLMTLRHCPHHALHGGTTEGCLRCFAQKTVEDKLTDRRGEDFSIRPYRAASGCRAQLLNAHVLNLLPRARDIIGSGAQALRVLDDLTALERWRTVLNGGEPAVTTLLNGETYGHYDRGVE
jgi:putative protease